MNSLIPDLQQFVFHYLMDFCVVEIQNFDKPEFHVDNLYRVNAFQKLVTEEMAEQWYIDHVELESPERTELFKSLKQELYPLQCKPYEPADWC